MSTYEATVPQLSKMLTNLEAWLDEASSFAQKKAFDPNVLLAARLAPDQYPLVRQIQAACDCAKFACARLTGKEAPRHPDTEATFDEVRARIRAARSFVESVKSSDFEGAEARLVEMPFLPGQFLEGHDYLNEMALPNFYFHATTAYAILRHAGVDLGKTDFIGSLRLRAK
jgi:hypothetical protein